MSKYLSIMNVNDFALLLKQTDSRVLHWNYRGFTEFPLQRLEGEENKITDIYLKENLICRLPSDIGRLNNLESLYLSGNDITELPKEIARLSRLKCLDLSGNRLECIPEEIGEVRNLKFLMLDENHLRELPLRLAELRMLRYLSVCDNKLQWLPQKPVYNYYHCEFRFWRNHSLKSIPYSLWFHMFSEKQTRSLSIGCLNIPICKETSHTGRCVVQLNQDNEFDIHMNFPTKYKHIVNKGLTAVPSLFELSKRKFYEIICKTAKKLTSDSPSIYSHIHYDEKYQFENNNNIPETIRKGYCVPSDVIEEYFYYLPRIMKDDLCNGPVSRCQNSFCQKPLFDYVYFEFCIEKIILFDSTEDIILSAAFCSNSCARLWTKGKNLLNWKFI